jgi:hypothetical protein
MKNLTEMISYLKEAIQFQTAADIYELPRDEFTPYVNRCKEHVPLAAVQYCVLVMLIEERSSFAFRIKKLLRLVK